MGMCHRRSIRLKEYDYSQEGAYFITICTSNRINYFEYYPKLKTIVTNEWKKLLDRYDSIALDEFVVMPNHVHGIIFIVGAGFTPARMDLRATARVAPTIGRIIGAYKSLCIHEWIKCLKRNNLQYPGKIWQRNYYERIIRNEDELNEKREYVQNNPINWEMDENFNG